MADILSFNGFVPATIKKEDSPFPFDYKEFKDRAVNVKWFGAKGNGITDDTAAIQAAYNAIKNTGGVLFFPSGHKFLTSNTIGARTYTIDEFAENISIIGYGATILSTLQDSDNKPVMCLLGKNLRIYGLTFEMVYPINPETDSRTNQAGNCLCIGGITNNYGEDIEVKDCRFLGSWYAGIRPAWAKRVIIENNYIERWLATGIFPGEILENIVIKNNILYNGLDDGIFCGSKASLATKQVIISNNIIERTYSKGIGIGGAQNVNITGNIVKNTWGPGIIIERNVWSSEGTGIVNVHGNILLDIGKNYGADKRKTSASSVPFAIYTSESNGIELLSIQGNQIKNFKKNGIVVSNTNRLQIINNMLQNGSGIGIQVGLDSSVNHDNVSDFIIANNNIYNITATGIYVSKCQHGNITGNRIRTYGASGGFVDRAIFVYNSNHIQVSANQIFNDNGAEQTISTGGTNIDVMIGPNLVSDPSTDISVYYGIPGSKRIVFGSSIPAIGTWQQGDIIINVAAVAGGYIGWVCVTAGTPGTWKAFGAISA